MKIVMFQVNGVDVSTALHDEAVLLLTGITGQVILEVSRDLDPLRSKVQGQVKCQRLSEPEVKSEDVNKTTEEQNSSSLSSAEQMPSTDIKSQCLELTATAIVEAVLTSAAVNRILDNEPTGAANTHSDENTTVEDENVTCSFKPVSVEDVGTVTYPRTNELKDASNSDVTKRSELNTRDVFESSVQRSNPANSLAGVIAASVLAATTHHALASDSRAAEPTPVSNVGNSVNHNQMADVLTTSTKPSEIVDVNLNDTTAARNFANASTDKVDCKSVDNLTDITHPKDSNAAVSKEIVEVQSESFGVAAGWQPQCRTKKHVDISKFFAEKVDRGGM